MESPSRSRTSGESRVADGRPAPNADRRSAVAFLVGTLIYQAGRLGLSLIAARALGPQIFGDWVLISLLIVYLSAVGLGVTNGAGHQIPFRAGAGDAISAQRIAEVATGASVLAGVGAAVVAVAICAVILPNPSPATLALVGVAAALQHPFLLQQVLFRSWFAFGRAAFQLAFLGGVVLLGGIALLRYELDGLLMAQIVTFLVAVVAGSVLLPIQTRPRLDRATLHMLVRIGFPIMLAGFTFGLLTTLDRWLVASFLTREDVGYYGLVGIALSGLLLLPQLLAQQFYPRMSFARGAGVPHGELLSMAHRQGLLAGALVAGLAALTVVAAWAFVPLVLDNYRESLLPLTIACIGVVAYAFASGYGNLLLAVDFFRRFLAIQVMAAGLNLALGIGFLSIGMGLPGVAAASAVGMAAYSMMLLRAATSAAAPRP